MAPQGVAYFPGLGPIRSATYTLGHGITPGVCTIVTVPLPTWPAQAGTLVFEFGSASISFPMMLVDRHSVRTGGSGRFWTLNLLDRRWLWRFGFINGSYNIRRSENEIDEDTKKSSRELAKLCLNAMEETGFDVSALPDDTFPFVDWIYDNPAEELAKICDLAGCRVVLTTNSTVVIAKLGEGGHIPDSLVSDDSQELNPPEIPDKIIAVCAETLFQVDLELEAVAIDNDHEFKFPDDLSYKPAAGWSKVDPRYFAEVADEDDRKLALRTMYRCYRIKTPVKIPELKPDGTHEDVDDLRRITLTSEQIDKDTGMLGDKPSARPAWLYGSWYNGTETYDNTIERPQQSANEKTRIDGFTIDDRRKMVILSQPVYRRKSAEDEPFEIEPAKLRLRTAVAVRLADTWEYSRYTKEKELGDQGIPERVVKLSEVYLTRKTTYDDNYEIVGVAKNTTTIDPEIEVFLNGAAAEYQTQAAYSRVLQGLHDLSPDGAIQQVQWSVGDGPAYTMASRNNENLSRTVSYKERRIYDKLIAATGKRDDEGEKSKKAAGERPREVRG